MNPPYASDITQWCKASCQGSWDFASTPKSKTYRYKVKKYNQQLLATQAGPDFGVSDIIYVFSFDNEDDYTLFTLTWC